MSPARFSRRLYENYPYGASYGCAVEHYECRPSLGHRLIVPVGLVLIAVTAVLCWLT